MMAAENIRADVFPAEIHGWVLAPERGSYTAVDLYTCINTAAELYISCGCKNLQVWRYEKAGWPEIKVDLFDMGEAENASAVFARGQENPDQDTGRNSEYMDGMLRFWRGKYYVSILCSPETPEARTAVMALGRRLAQSLPPIQRGST